MRVPRTKDQRDKMLRERAKKSLREAFMAGWVAGQFSVLPDTDAALARVCDSLSEHECEEAFRAYLGETP